MTTLHQAHAVNTMQEKPVSRLETERSDRVFNGTTAVILAALICLQIHNITTYPAERGFDAWAHWDYVRYIQLHHKLPLPHQGWEMFQAPVYYVLASLLPGQRAVQWCGGLSWVLLGIGSWMFFQSRFGHQLAAMGTVLMLSVPVVIYLTPAIGNEFFSAAVISLALFYYLSNWERTVATRIGFGLALSIALLSKATALTLLATMAIDQLWQMIEVPRHSWSELFADSFHRLQLWFIPIILMLLLSSWFYVRNAIVYGNPLMANTDFPQFPIDQMVHPRTWQFFADISAFRRGDLYRAINYSFLAGTYFSWFYDCHRTMVPDSSNAGVLSVVMSAPLFSLAVAGFVRAIVLRNDNAIARSNYRSVRVLLVYSCLLLAGYVAYNFKLPYSSTVKGALIVTLVGPYTFGVLTAVQDWSTAREYQLLVYLGVYCLLVVKHYWILPSWYGL